MITMQRVGDPEVSYHETEWGILWADDDEVTLIESEDEARNLVREAKRALEVKAEVVTREVYVTAWAEVTT